MRSSIWKPVLVGTLVCGTLDILFVVMLTLWRGKDPAAKLRFVASGPVPSATNWGAGGSALGLLVHFTLMAMMVAVFVFAARPPKPLSVGTQLFAHVVHVGLPLAFITRRFLGPRGIESMRS